MEYENYLERIETQRRIITEDNNLPLEEKEKLYRLIEETLQRAEFLKIEKEKREKKLKEYEFYEGELKENLNRTGKSIEQIKSILKESESSAKESFGLSKKVSRAIENIQEKIGRMQIDAILNHGRENYISDN